MNSTPDFECALQVRIGDVNYGNHLGHERLLSMLHEARLLFLRALNTSENNFFGGAIILRKLQIHYKNQALWGDILKIAIAVANVRAMSFTLQYQVVLREIHIAQATMEMVCFDYANAKIATLPQQFADNLQKLRQNHEVRC